MTRRPNGSLTQITTGSATAKIWWGSNLPVRLDIRIRGDSVSLKDVAWVYPTLPTEGGGPIATSAG